MIFVLKLMDRTQILINII